jgi:hypothetical protein
VEYSSGLAEALKPFFKKEYGDERSGDEISVAVNVAGAGAHILEAINSLFDSSSGEAFLRQEAECWLKSKYACENARRSASLLKGKP